MNVLTRYRHRVWVPIASVLPHQVLAWLDHHAPIDRRPEEFNWSFWTDASYLKWVRHDKRHPTVDDALCFCDGMPSDVLPRDQSFVDDYRLGTGSGGYVLIRMCGESQARAIRAGTDGPHRGVCSDPPRHGGSR